MEKYDVKFKKKLGQNFLKDNTIVKRIVDVSNIDKNSLVIEVGPGGAIMTKELANVAKNVLAYEIDSDLAPEIERKLEGYDNIDIIFQDFLVSDLRSDISNYSFKHLYFVSNVPYYITTPIILKLIKSKLYFDNIVMMVQKEVGDRFSTSPGSREYGSITVYLSAYFDVSLLFDVNRNNFTPVPNVDSSIIKFVKNNKYLSINNMDVFNKLLKDSFFMKRKNIKNNLHNYDIKLIERVLSKYDLSLSDRAENMPLDAFIDIANEIS